MAKPVPRKFVPREISASSAAQGYNNEGRGKLIGYIAEPNKHEKTCAYRMSTRGNKSRRPGRADEADKTFAVAHDCINPNGHDVIPSCGALACSHCSKVFWQ